MGQTDLLLGVHVEQQVGDAVAVAELVVIPAERKRFEKRFSPRGFSDAEPD